MRPGATSAADVAMIAKMLSRRYGDADHFNRKNPLEELLYIVCSIQTNEDLYRKTFASLRRGFPTFESLASASESEIASVIREGGLANQKAAKIKRMLGQIVERFGQPSLAQLKTMDDVECETFLTTLTGVGKKTARCVMMYSLERQVFPVDVHCWRICRRIGWVRATRLDHSCSPRDMDRLQSKIPATLRHSLHVNLVSLGRDLCTAQSPKCDICPIRSYCRRIGVSDGYEG